MSPEILNSLEDRIKVLRENFGSSFVFEFTKQLIFNSSPIEVLKFRQEMQKEVPEQKKEVSEEIKEIVHEALQPPPERVIFNRSNLNQKTHLKNLSRARLFIPKVNLPERFNYLKPSATSQDLDLGELNSFLRDPMVKTIECQGEGTNVLVRGSIGHKKTALILNEDQIKGIIQKFSDASKIPVQEGFFKVAFGKYIIMAIYSEVIGSKFIIQKISSFQRY